MTQRVFNFGSLNIDRVYRVPHIARPGETLASSDHRTLAGGKGANQSIALARAGARVSHCGKVGKNGAWLIELLTAEGVDTQSIFTSDLPTGEAIIQVGDDGENAIVLMAGANHTISKREIDVALAGCEAGTTVLTQHETNEVSYLIERAASLGLPVTFNPAPFNAHVLEMPLTCVSTLVLNETEGAGLSGERLQEEILKELRSRLPRTELILTLGSRGVIYDGGQGRLSVPAVEVKAVDTTAAGDTFIGYYLAARLGGAEVLASLQLAVRAAAICVGRQGAIDSIPHRRELGG
jgi:ribokinase